MSLDHALDDALDETLKLIAALQWSQHRGEPGDLDALLAAAERVRGLLLTLETNRLIAERFAADLADARAVFDSEVSSAAQSHDERVQRAEKWMNERLAKGERP